MTLATVTICVSKCWWL